MYNELICPLVDSVSTACTAYPKDTYPNKAETKHPHANGKCQLYESFHLRSGELSKLDRDANFLNSHRQLCMDANFEVVTSAIVRAGAGDLIGAALALPSRLLACPAFPYGTILGEPLGPENCGALGSIKKVSGP